MRSTSPDGRIIIYVTQRDDRQNAVSVNTQRRKRLLESIGYTVTHIQCDNRELIRVCTTIWAQRHTIRYIIIRIDGSGIVDKYTLVKLLLPHIPVIWEIHGIPQELLSFSKDFPVRFAVWKNILKRWILSLFADGCICISEELLSHIKCRQVVRTSVVIPNFLFRDEVPDASEKHATALSCFIKPDTFIVLWGGDPRLPWHALDDMNRVAKLVWKENKRILFVFVGSDYYYPLPQLPNTLYLPAVPHAQFLALAASAHICIALYKQFSSFPIYFSPVKFLECLSMGKPVITSRGAGGNLIRHGENGYLITNVRDAAHRVVELEKKRSIYGELSRNALRFMEESAFESTPQLLYRRFLSLWLHEF